MIYRGRTKDIVFEFSPSTGEIKGVIILCEGLPAVPKQKELISFLSSRNYFIVYPRYKGTWESNGKFLSESPVNDLEEIMNLLKKREITELYSNKTFSIDTDNIIIIGSSLGGSIALSCSKNNLASKIVVFSPIVNFSAHNDKNQEQDLIWLEKFVRKAFGMGYRYKREDWVNMTKGLIFNPPQEIEKDRAKDILVIFGKQDTEIDFKKIENYTEKNKIETICLKDEGHLSFSKISQEIWDKVFDWLK